MIEFIKLDKTTNQYVFVCSDYGTIRVGKKSADNPNGAASQAEAAVIAEHCFDVVPEPPTEE